ncbi:hypothetical protein [Streptomyces wuyuanensis]|uniref:VMAP-C domain-containing protein n=1 Tax=Streptomyces wuyuanensis TaxID=1196353 RepID=UPI00343D9C88
MSKKDFRLQLLEQMAGDPRCRDIDSEVPEKDSARAHIHDMLNVAASRSDPPGVLEALCARLQALAPNDGSLPWLQVIVLSLAEDKPLPADSMLPLIQALRSVDPPPRPKELLPYTARAGRGLSLLTGYETLPEILVRIADQRNDQGPAVLARFLQALTGDEQSRHYAQLSRARELLSGLDLPASASDDDLPDSDYRLIIQIRLEPEDAPHIDDARYGLHVTCYRQPRDGGTFSRVCRLADPVSLRKSELTAGGSKSLNAWDELADELNAAQSRPTRIEFVLPAALLGHPAELWSTGATQQSLGHHHPVVVRSRERYIDCFISKEPWSDRWKNLRQISSTGDVLDLIGWPDIHPDKATEFTTWIIDQPALACLGLSQPYDDLPSSIREAVNAAMFTEGIPAMLWLRNADAPDTLMAALRVHTPDCLTDLPDIIHQCRRRGRTAEEHDVRNNITLLWEDPDCVDRKQDNQFAGMM